MFTKKKTATPTEPTPQTLSARAGSFATEVSLRTSRAGVVEDVVTVELPEEVHTGSPREVFCPRATATSRPPG